MDFEKYIKKDRLSRLAEVTNMLNSKNVNLMPVDTYYRLKEEKRDLEYLCQGYFMY